MTSQISGLKYQPFHHISQLCESGIWAGLGPASLQFHVELTWCLEAVQWLHLCTGDLGASAGRLGSSELLFFLNTHRLKDLSHEAFFIFSSVGGCSGTMPLRYLEAMLFHREGLRGPSWVSLAGRFLSETIYETPP